jgi:hypothetical protein
MSGHEDMRSGVNGGGACGGDNEDGDDGEVVLLGEEDGTSP